MKNHQEIEDIKNKAEVIADVMGILSQTIKQVTNVLDKWEQPTKETEVTKDKEEEK